MYFNFFLIIFFYFGFVGEEYNEEKSKKGFVYFESIYVDQILVKNKFILDSGSNISIIDKTLFSQLKLKLKGTTINKDILGNKKKRKIYSVKKLRIGEKYFYNVDFIVLDLKNYLKCNNILGIIGTNVLSKTIIKIDFNKRKVNLIKKIEKKDEYNKFEIKLKNKLPYVNLFLRNKKFRFLLDTGNLNSLTLKNKDYEFITEKNSSKVWNIKVLINSINNSNFSFHKIPVSYINEVSLGRKIKMNSSKVIFLYNRNLGVDFFQNSLMIIDFKNKDGYIKNKNITSKKNIEIERFIRISHKENFFYVSQITKNGTYEKKHQIKLGDTIDFVNKINLTKRRVKYLTYKDLCKIDLLIERELNKSIVKLKVRRNKK